MKAEEIGLMTATIFSIRTTTDGGARISFDVTAKDSTVIQKLLKIKLQGNALIECGMVKIEEEL